MMICDAERQWPTYRKRKLFGQVFVPGKFTAAGVAKHGGNKRFVGRHFSGRRVGCGSRRRMRSLRAVDAQPNTLWGPLATTTHRKSLIDTQDDREGGKNAVDNRSGCCTA